MGSPSPVRACVCGGIAEEGDVGTDGLVFGLCGVFAAEAVDGPNALLVVNGRVNLNQRPVRRAQRDPTVVEAATVVRAHAAHAH